MELSLDHVVLEVRDVLRSVAFYRDILGLDTVRLEEFQAGQAPFVSARLNARTIIDLFPPALWRDASGPANPNHFCITSDAAFAREVEARLARSGVPIDQRRPRNFGAQGWGTAFYFTDPDGISVEVRYYDA